MVEVIVLLWAENRLTCRWVFLCTVVVVNSLSNSSFEAGIADEHSRVLPLKRFNDKSRGQYRKFSGLCVAAEVNVLKNGTVLITLKS